MLEKFVLVAVLVGTTTPALASDASDDGRAARQARETTFERQRAGGGAVEADDARRNAKTERLCEGRSESGDCACRCMPNGPGLRTEPDSATSYGG